ncbi:diheme cytochrome c [Pseudothauera rhizosphaerae]|uniref:Cytochrome C n=1 Tax=Pseudothauera rhizosphaerae TaxID=2565932 RepID=A0A4S4AY92_9RHOO|nr:diheme cytochrome c [Pseudothauera rhizosphaerae]THF65077.1 cytochrome C [Pseudothauera rhizosphaerae]
MNILRRISPRAVLATLLVLAPGLFVLDKALAGGGHYYPPVADAVVAEECGGCHLAFPAAMLPARSWARMMQTLDRHFGDDASLDARTAERIETYLMLHAADGQGARYAGKMLRGVAPGQAPLRITELPKWRREHREVSRAEWADPKVGSKANCAACHRDAERGYFED